MCSSSDKLSSPQSELIFVFLSLLKQNYCWWSNEDSSGSVCVCMAIATNESPDCERLCGGHYGANEANKADEELTTTMSDVCTNIWLGLCLSQCIGIMHYRRDYAIII